MSKNIDYYFTPISPWTLLGTPTFRKLVADSNATVNYKPINIMELFATANVKPPGERPEPIQKYRLIELQRWREYRDIPLNLKPAHFPTNPTLACKMIIAAANANGDVGELTEAFLRACWLEERQVADESTATDIADACGFDGQALLVQANSDAPQATFDANTAEAIEKGAWGSPSYIVDGELFWGQDRLPFVEQKLTA